MSQSMALAEYLEEAGNRVETVFAGCSHPESLPGYFRDCFRDRVQCFRSPHLLRSPNRKGILVGRTILFNLVRGFAYLKEVNRIRKMINEIRPDIVFNFYDPVGALALRKLDPAIRRIGIGHQFFIHLDGYRCKGGQTFHRWLLGFLSGLIMKNCDRILALSFRESEGHEQVEVFPPLIRKKFREIRHTPGDRYLVYFQNEGYIYDLIILARENPNFVADIFTGVSPGIELPTGLHLHSPDEKQFTEKMATCRGLITTSGFDTVAEAAYLGIPLVVVPAQNHFEQLCNAADTERSGFGHAVMKLTPGTERKMETYDNKRYRQWVDSAAERILHMIQS